MKKTDHGDMECSQHETFVGKTSYLDPNQDSVARKLFAISFKKLYSKVMVGAKKGTTPLCVLLEMHEQAIAWNELIERYHVQPEQKSTLKLVR